MFHISSGVKQLRLIIWESEQVLQPSATINHHLPCYSFTANKPMFGSEKSLECDVFYVVIVRNGRFVCDTWITEKANTGGIWSMLWFDKAYNHFCMKHLVFTVRVSIFCSHRYFLKRLIHHWSWDSVNIQRSGASHFTLYSAVRWGERRIIIELNQTNQLTSWNSITEIIVSWFNITNALILISICIFWDPSLG